MIKVKFPDNSIKEFNDQISVEEIAKSISISLAKKAIAGTIDGKLVGLDYKLIEDCSINILTQDSDEALSVLRNTALQLLKFALVKFNSHIHFGEAALDEHGFYLDTDNEEGNQVSSDDLNKIEKNLQQLISDKVQLVHKLMPLDDALKLANGNPYETQLMKQSAKNNMVEVCQINDYTSLSTGVSLSNAGKLKFIKLLSVGGAYWEGKSSNPMLQRIYGTAFFNKNDLEKDLQRRQEERERDHRVLGNDLDLFFVDPKVGAGLPYWMPNGATVRRTVERYIIDKEVEHGYQHVYTPILMNLDVYKTSGHWQHYREDMFPPMDMGDGEELELRPMNCPSHIQIYKHHIRSYRDLPLRIAELGMMHRYEKSGALSGFQRAREMTLNDGHTFVMPDQIQEEFKKILNLMIEVYADFDITDYSFRLSYRDPKNTEKYFDDDEMWNKAQGMLKNAMDDLGLDYVEAEGEAAFYGPKLDVQTKTALGNEETLSTIQLDFMLPEQFDLSYVGSDGQEHRPVMIHRGLVSTMERFTAYLTEIYKGAFPTWLSPQQVSIIPVNEDAHGDYAKSLEKQLSAAKIRVKVDKRNEKMNFKIRDAQTHKIPYIIVVGDKEKENASVSVRRYGEENSKECSRDEFLNLILDDIASYSRKN